MGRSWLAHGRRRWVGFMIEYKDVAALGPREKKVGGAHDRWVPFLTRKPYPLPSTQNVFAPLLADQAHEANQLPRLPPSRCPHFFTQAAACCSSP